MTNIANTDQHAAWNGDSGQRAVTDADRRDRVMAPVAEVLLAAANLGEGQDVLDLGCGCGATTIAAANAVAPTGTVWGIDLSAPMLDVARRRIDRAGLTHVSVEQGDAQIHALPRERFDVVISRFGTMFFADPVAAFTNIAGALRPRGRVCVATWQPMVANDWLTIPGAALLRYGSLPDTTGGPGMFAQSDPAAITATLKASGHLAIEVEPVAITLTLGADPDDATDYLAGTGVGRAVLDTVPDDHRPAALEAVRTVLADHADHAGVNLGAAIWITTAHRSP